MKKRSICNEFLISLPWSLEVVDEHAFVLCGEHAFAGVGELEDGIDDGQLRRCRLRAREGCPVVDYHASADLITASVDRACAHGNLDEGGDGVELSDGAHWVHQAALVGERGVAADEGLSSDRCLEGLNAEDVLDDLLCG